MKAAHSYNRELDTRLTKYFKYRMARRTLAQRKQRSQFVIALVIVLLVFINRKQRRHRNFLSRSSLLPNPSEGTPWQALYAANDDRAYIGGSHMHHFSGGSHMHHYSRVK